MDLMYLDNLDEFINDEGKIVTYRWLSLSLNVSSNVAKQMLFHYWDKNKDSKTEDSKLSLCYLLTGIKYDENLKLDCQMVSIVRDEDLERVRSGFKSVSSLHIYSVQRGRLKDIHSLYGTDYDKIKENVLTSAKYSGIKCPAAHLRTAEEETTLRKQREISAKETSIDVKPKYFQQKEENKENTSIYGNSVLSRKNATKGIASMFANQAKKAKVEDKKSDPKSTSKSFGTGSKAGSSFVAKKGSLSAFLTKKPPVQNVKKEEKVDVKKEEEDEVMEVEVEEIKIEESEEERDSSPKKEDRRTPKSNAVASKKSKKSPQVTKGKSSASQKGKRKSSQQNLKNSDSKRRRRIVAIQSSSSESSSEDEDEGIEECPLPSPPPSKAVLLSSDDEDMIPPTPERVGVKERKKGRTKKMVDKTFLDEDGFLVTKKEYELVSDSDSENPFPSPSQKNSPAKKTPPPPPPAKEVKKSPLKSKQSCITNFFKKK